jgi:riboflavin synthase
VRSCEKCLVTPAGEGKCPTRAGAFIPAIRRIQISILIGPIPPRPRSATDPARPATGRSHSARAAMQQALLGRRIAFSSAGAPVRGSARSGAAPPPCRQQQHSARPRHTPQQQQQQQQQQQRRGRAAAVRPVAMFTGIVQGLAQVVDVAQQPGLSTVRIALPAGAAAGIQIGASVAINGTCLTVTRIDGDTLSFDIMAETLRATNLGGLAAGGAVNFERSARVGDEIGGHSVSGHVHTKAVISDVQETPNNRRVVFELPDEAWMRYILPKGFIAVDGCSLTVGEVQGRTFSVYLIPETLRVTVFGRKGKGDSVNVEVEAQTQAIVDTVERVVARYMADRGL